jgi:hypothetical protein
VPGAGHGFGDQPPGTVDAFARMTNTWPTTWRSSLRSWAFA